MRARHGFDAGEPFCLLTAQSARSVSLRRARTAHASRQRLVSRVGDQRAVDLSLTIDSPESQREWSEDDEGRQERENLANYVNGHKKRRLICHATTLSRERVMRDALR